MASAWHKQKSKRPPQTVQVITRKPLLESYVNVVVQLVDSDEPSASALDRAFGVSATSALGKLVLKEPEVNAAMERRAIRLGLKSSCHYKKAKKEGRI